MGIHKNEYALLVETSREMMYRIAYGYLCNDTLALDAVDEAVYLGFIHRKELRNAAYSKTWLTRILINVCYKSLKKQKREIIIEFLPDNPVEEYDYLPIKEALQKLPEDLKKVVLLRYFGGYTIAETAEILEIPEGTVATRTRKALALLKVDLDD